MRSIFIPMVAACATFAMPVAAATVSIDSFDSTVGLFDRVTAPDGFGTEIVTESFVVPGAIGGTRTIRSERTSGPFEVKGTVFNGNASVSTDDSTTGEVTFSWMAGGVDLTDGMTNDAVRIGLVSADFASISYTLTFDGISKTKTAGDPDLDFMFTDADFAGVDFSNVNAISITVTGPTGFDTSFSFIEATNVSAVPLPAGGLLLIAGLGALGVARRKRG